MRPFAFAGFLAAAAVSGALFGFLAAGGRREPPPIPGGDPPPGVEEDAADALRRENADLRRRLEESEAGRRAAAAESARLRREREEALRARPGPTEPPSPVGWWYHAADGGEPALLDFRRDGVIVAPDREARWRLSGWRLLLTWPDPGAPGGAWEDDCVIAADGLAYAGRNQNGNLIRGTRKAE